MISKYLKDPKLRQAFSIQPLLVGGSPFDTTSIYGLIHFLERKWGVHFAMGGTGAMIAGIGRLMEEVGIDIRLNENRRQGDAGRPRATGVSLENGAGLAADIVVSNADPMHLFSADAARQAAGHRAEAEDARRASVDGAVPPLFRHAPAI